MHRGVAFLLIMMVVSLFVLGLAAYILFPIYEAVGNKVYTDLNKTFVGYVDADTLKGIKTSGVKLKNYALWIGFGTIVLACVVGAYVAGARERYY